MKNYWCEDCDYRWKADEIEKCPTCRSLEVRETMSPEKAKELGIYEK